MDSIVRVSFDGVDSVEVNVFYGTNTKMVIFNATKTGSVVLPDYNTFTVEFSLELATYYIFDLKGSPKAISKVNN